MKTLLTKPVATSSDNASELGRTEVHVLGSPEIDIYIASDGQPDVDYCYGGTRCVPCDTGPEAILRHLKRLMNDESGLKNRLINRAICEPIFEEQIVARLPKGFLGSRVGGARCILRPKSRPVHDVLLNPDHPAFTATIMPALEVIGDKLNALGGRVRLTPDFGTHARVSDLLHRFTDHVLGVCCSSRGCGGKASYTVTGILSTSEAFLDSLDGPVTIIGSAGALGRGMAQYFLDRRVDDVAVCDLRYERGNAVPPAGLAVLPAQEKAFTDPCLRRGGLIVATTFGEELENSAWERIPAGTRLVLAHNLALPPGLDGIDLARRLARRGVLAVPGQLLTLAGALTSRIEAFHRQRRSAEPFDKPLAHAVVKAVGRILATRTRALVREQSVTPHEAMLQYAGTPC